MRYEFIAAHAGEYGVKRMCQALEVTRSGYYAWRNHPVGVREQANRELAERIKQEHEESRQTYGSPRHLGSLTRARDDLWTTSCGSFDAQRRHLP